MAVNQIQPKGIQELGRKRFHFDVSLLVFLLVGWSLIFATATWGLQRDKQQWLPIGLVSRIVANYSVNTTTSPHLARIEPEVVEAVKQDQILMLTILTATPTSTLLPASTQPSIVVNTPLA
ncbi:MAG: hypothetical protein HYR94_23390, partial [Chloroflexi bacterium]|nr:hypothetical protein [Chloroflexota bacterium]